MVDESTRSAVLGDLKYALRLTKHPELDELEKQELVEACVFNFQEYVNPGILEYRKSVSSDATCVEWYGEGSLLTDVQGREFIDCYSSFGVHTLGQRHPRVVQAVMDEIGRQTVHSQELLDPLRGCLAKALAMLTPGDLKYSFLCNSGTEATEGALKFAKLYAQTKKPAHTRGIISTTRGFHGKSMGSLSVTGKSEFREPFHPMVPGVRFVPYGDADALDKELKICATIGFDIAAFIAEPVQGEAGAIVPPDDYFPKVREICDKWDVLLICDEVQTGMGRTGRLWGIEHWGVAPDIMGMAKALGGGVMPIGNIIVTEKVYEPMFENPALHTTTFGGNPLSAAAALAALEVTLEERIPEQAEEKGAYLIEAIRNVCRPHPALVDEVRGLGLLIGVEFASMEIGYAVATGLFRNGILVPGSLNNAKTFRFMPAAVISRPQLDRIVEALAAVLEEVEASVRSGRLFKPSAAP